MCCAQLEVLVGTGEYQSYLVRALCHVNHPLVQTTSSLKTLLLDHGLR